MTILKVVLRAEAMFTPNTTLEISTPCDAFAFHKCVVHDDVAFDKPMKLRY